MSRRSLLRGTGVTAATAAVGLSNLGGSEAIAAAGGDPQGYGSDARHYRTRLVLLGTAGGPSSAATDRYGIAAAVVVGEAVYLVDCGRGAMIRARQAGLGSGESNDPLDRLRAVFLTHLHSDHTVDYPDIQVTSVYNGATDASRPVHVYGPGDRGAPFSVAGDRQVPPQVNAENPTPGIEAMTRSIHAAFATDLNERIRSSGSADPRETLQPHDIELPPGLDVDPNSDPAPATEPFTVHEDEKVRVSATLVDHAPAFPAFAFRVDSDDGAIAFSGDTAPSDNLVKLAHGADVLVHEVIDKQWVHSTFGPGPHSPKIEALIAHLLGAHTTIEQVGSVADKAEVGTLVLSHFVPPTNPKRRWQEARDGFSGRLVVGEDLMELGVGTRSRSR